MAHAEITLHVVFVTLVNKLKGYTVISVRSLKFYQKSFYQQLRIVFSHLEAFCGTDNQLRNFFLIQQLLPRMLQAFKLYCDYIYMYLLLTQ